MGRIILVLCLLISSVVSAQPGYTNINARYKWIAGGFDSSFILPRYNGVPSGLRSAWNTDGQLAVDTANNRLYVYSGGAWIRLANYSDVGVTPTLQQVLTAGSTLTTSNTIDGGNDIISWNNFDQFNITTVGGTLITDNNAGVDAIVDVSSANVLLRAANTGSSHGSDILLTEPSITLNPNAGSLIIDTLTNAVGTKALRYNPTSGLVSYADTTSGGGSSGITVGTTTITSGTNKRIPFNNSGVYSESANLTQETNQIKVTGTSSTTPLLVDAHEDATAEILQVNDNATKVFSVNVDGVLDLSDNSSAPSTPASGYGRVYSRADSLRFKNDAGTEFTLGRNSGSTDSTVVRNQRWKYRNTFERMDDFIEVTPLGWIGTTTGGGGAAALVTDNILTNVDTTYWGVVKNSTGTSGTGKAISYQGNNGSGAAGYVRQRNNKKYIYEVGSVWLPALSDSTGGTNIYFATFGLIDWWASANPNTGIQFIYDRSNYGNYWAIRSDNAGSISTVVTTIPVTASTKYTLRFEITNWHMLSSGGSIKAYINDTEVVASSGTYPIVSNLPEYFTANFALYPSLLIEKRAGTTDFSVYADWVYSYAELINR